MAELRSEVEGLRNELALAKQKDSGGEMALINYIQARRRRHGQCKRVGRAATARGREEERTQRVRLGLKSFRCWGDGLLGC